MSILSDLRHFIRHYTLIPPESRVVVGVSGGPDSLALLHALSHLAKDESWYLHAAYLHHGLRAEADAEARFVAEVAAAWNLGCTVERADVRKLARQPGVSLEEAARQVRYAFLGDVAEELGASIIAVGHNADDQVETVLMHLLRGSGLAGLRGMLPKTPLASLHLPLIPPEQRPQNLQVQLVRPWLQTTRSQILAYCQKNGLQPREDATNTDTTFFRNRLRHEVIPQLRRINPRLTRVIGRTALALQGDYEALAQHRARLWQDLAHPSSTRVRFPLAAFRALPVGDQRALLRRAIAHLRPDLRNINWEHSERLLTILQSDPKRRSGGPYTLVAGLQAWLIADSLDISEKDDIVSDVPQIEQARSLTLPGTLPLNDGWRLQARRVQWSAGQPPPWQNTTTPDCIWLPLDIPAPLQVRPRQSGDRIAILGLGGSKAISDLMTELKLPRFARSQWPLLVDAQGRILWLLQGRASEYCRIPPTATAAWEICLYHDDGLTHETPCPLGP
ncbi:MAG: tRNA lysidine(34) synthetase TilS [Chloroflexi bacterium]|nr:tRNA lysidine(34) synthetase TilS [Chloroflexota bacterium]